MPITRREKMDEFPAELPYAPAGAEQHRSDRRHGFMLPLVPKLLFGNALPRNSVSAWKRAKRSFAKTSSQTGVWEPGGKQGVQMSFITLDRVSRWFGNYEALHEICLDL